MGEQGTTMASLVDDFKKILDSGVPISALIARGYNPQLVEAAATGTPVGDIVQRDSTMPESVEAVKQTVAIF